MTNEMMEAEVQTMKEDIAEIKKNLKDLPQEISSKINDTLDLKIKIAISEAENKYQAKFISLGIAVIAELVGLVISFITK